MCAFVFVCCACDIFVPLCISFALQRDGIDLCENLATAGLWVGSAFGLSLLREGSTVQLEDRWRYFGGDRWLPGSTVVTAVAGNTLGAAWVLLETGLAHVKSAPYTLDQKAKHYTSSIETFSRYGWLAAVGLRGYGDLAGPVRY